MATDFPGAVILRTELGARGYVYHETEGIPGLSGLPAGCVARRVGDIWSPLEKIEFEAAKVDSKYVHIRFSRTNKYWARINSQFQDWVVAISDQREENTSSPSCTLFEPFFDDNGLLFFRYVRSGTMLSIRSNGLLVHGTATQPNSLISGYTIIDYDTLVKLPQHVTFKGYNDKYLKSVLFQGSEHLHFSSDDPDEEETGYEITALPNGYIRIFSKFFGKFWRRSSIWILADSTDTEGRDNNTLFWPVKVDEHTIALRSASNSRFCRINPGSDRTDYLIADSATVAKVSRLRVEELVLDRYIFRVRFHMEDAHIYDEQAFLAGSGTAINNTQHENEFTINISYEDTSSFSFSNSLSISTGVSTTFKTGIPRIAEAGIEVSTEVTKGFEWNRETIETKTVEASYTAVVPPMSIIRVDYVGTRGSCNIPFSYNQRDKRTDGNFTTTKHVDGVYTGVNYFDFHFEQPKIYPVANASNIMAESNVSKITAVAGASKIRAAYASKVKAEAPVVDASKITAEAESNYPIGEASKIIAEAESNYPVADASKSTTEAESNE